MGPTECRDPGSPGQAVYVYAAVAEPAGVATSTVAGPADPTGTSARNDVPALFTVTPAAAVPPIVTAAPWRSVPLMVTLRPPVVGPEDGATDEIVGAR
jgi:hypothetical protein